MNLTIPTRQNAPYRRAFRLTQPLNLSQKQLLYGSLLGDACLHQYKLPSKLTDEVFIRHLVRFSHCAAQLSYLEHKKCVLRKGSKIVEGVSMSGTKMFSFVYKSVVNLPEIAMICLKNGVKTVSKEWLNLLNFEGLSYWYQDDGQLSFNPKTGWAQLTFHTNSFTFDELDLLQEKLRECGVSTYWIRSANPNPNERLLMSVFPFEARQFLEKIRSYIVPAMTYKIAALEVNFTKCCLRRNLQLAERLKLTNYGLSIS